MPIAVTWIQGTLRVSNGSQHYGDEQFGYSREEFPAALADFLQRARMKSDEVFLGTDSPLLIPLMEEIPPATPAIAAKLIQRRAEKAKAFNEPVYCGRTLEADSDKAGPQRFLVHVAPEAWVQEIGKQLDARGYHLAGVFPAALALGPVLEKLPGDPKEAVLLAADAESGVLQVLGRRNGAILFYRTLAGAGGRSGEDLLREFRRMSLFGEQRRGVKVREIFLAGEETLAARGRMGQPEDVQIVPAGVAVEPMTYLRWLLKASPGSPDNVVPRTTAMRTRILRLRVYVNLALVGFLAFGMTWLAGRMLARSWKIDELRRLREDHAGMVRKLKGEQQGLIQFARDREILRILRDETDVHVPEVLYRALPKLLPPELELTSFQIRLDETQARAEPPVAVWRVQITGRTEKADTAVVPLVRKFTEALERPPWKMRVTGSTLQEGPDAKPPPGGRGPGNFYVQAELR